MCILPQTTDHATSQVQRACDTPSAELEQFVVIDGKNPGSPSEGFFTFGRFVRNAAKMMEDSVGEGPEADAWAEARKILHRLDRRFDQLLAMEDATARAHFAVDLARRLYEVNQLLGAAR